MLQRIIDNCNAGDLGMDKCADAGLINDAFASCNIPNLVPEQIDGVLDKLPGDNPPTGWDQSVETTAEQRVKRHVRAHRSSHAWDFGGAAGLMT